MDKIESLFHHILSPYLTLSSKSCDWGKIMQLFKGWRNIENGLGYMLDRKKKKSSGSDYTWVVLIP